MEMVLSDIKTRLVSRIQRLSQSQYLRKKISRFNLDGRWNAMSGRSYLLAILLVYTHIRPPHLIRASALFEMHINPAAEISVVRLRTHYGRQKISVTGAASTLRIERWPNMIRLSLACSLCIRLNVFSLKLGTWYGAHIVRVLSARDCLLVKKSKLP